MLRKKREENLDQRLEDLLTDKSFIQSNYSNVSKENLPDWYDEKLFKQGQDYFSRNVLSMSAAALTGLITVLTIPTTLDILVFTKRSGCPRTAYRRYFETILHIYSLYTSDIDDPKSRFWKSLNTIRWKHSTNSKVAGENGVGFISQRDMALTQFGFIGYALLQPDKLGLTNDKAGREGLNHFWRVIGFMIDISNNVNICRESEEQTTEFCRKLLERVFTKWMTDTPKHFNKMIDAMLEGLWYVDVVLDADAMMYFWYDLNGLTYNKPLSWYSKFNYAYRKSIIFILGVPFIGQLVRVGFNNYLKLTYWFLERWPVIAWLKFGSEDSRINLYPIST
ncbi:GSCOCG00011194001-RA-CDS [Cotesia congregata]|uniref:ER-bound oxygenase mpaB/mpaB'/Rubber oxygenase catalytic domain-containing protein n=1 Tax=Cotesia congregata TaxID=51543 RepID=A0A8J2MHJ1_COTCN|nr:GSCOCG00011194001-RA-CDS [Cotesia congregata]CAG5083482.1 Protein of unknown function [Cotesia congregata]